ncbi:MAG: universal stress protein [Acetobacteraceae bacterium]|jgi:nucleotide-binding universal stress UspA family protein
MVDVIVAVLGRRETARGVLDAAQCLAGLAGEASVIVLAVDTPPPSSPFMAEALMAEMGDVAAARAQDRRRIASLKATFDAWAGDARQAGVTVQWDEVAGPANVAIEQRGRRADVIVIARPMDDDDEPTRHGFQAALFHTERPILVVPPGPSARFGRCVAIAWRDDGRTVKAVIPALRCLAGAEQFHLLAGVREGTARPSVPAVLQDHGISASLHILPIGAGPFGRALLEKLHEINADMLIMGAYAHNPLREMVFGGVTRYMLDHADVPVLMRH